MVAPRPSRRTDSTSRSRSPGSVREESCIGSVVSASNTRSPGSLYDVTIMRTTAAIFSASVAYAPAEVSRTVACAGPRRRTREGTGTLRSEDAGPGGWAGSRESGPLGIG
ncbi:hypothetical protein GCM10025787_60630 [Saccharopolyspora rosea]